MADGTLRPARPDDVPEVLGMVAELAAYERAPSEAVATPALLASALFGEHPACFCHVVEHAGDGTRLGAFALWFRSFSTWRGRHGIYLEDLFVRPAARRLGYGRALLAELAALAVEHGYPRLEWSVLDWNTPAHDFYATLGAEPQQEWTVWRVGGAALDSLASRPARAR